MKLQIEKRKNSCTSKWLQCSVLQRWSHHILKRRMNRLVIHRLNHMNKRSKGKTADWERGGENKQPLAFWFTPQRRKKGVKHLLFFFWKEKCCVDCKCGGEIYKCACGIRNALGFLSERFYDSPQRNLIFMTAMANHTVKYKTYLHRLKCGCASMASLRQCSVHSLLRQSDWAMYDSTVSNTKSFFNAFLSLLLLLPNSQPSKRRQSPLVLK